MKKLVKWLDIAALVLAVLVVVVLLSLDTILRVVAESSIRAQTGMQVEIGKFHVGLFEPVVAIKDFKIYNPPEFGGAPFLTIPEIHVEYDRDALMKNKIHLTLVRFNLSELNIVKNETGKTNVFAFGFKVPQKEKGKGGGQPAPPTIQRQPGPEFQGIDVLNVSIGTAKFIDLKDARNNREQKIAIDNIPIRNIKTPYDLAGLAALITLRGGDFFTATFGT